MFWHVSLVPAVALAEPGVSGRVGFPGSWGDLC